MSCISPLYASRTWLRQGDKLVLKEKKVKIYKNYDCYLSDFNYYQNHEISDGSIEFFKLPCGQCINCRLSRSKEWANRLSAEAQSSNYSYFVTLTYDDEHLPKGAFLRPTLRPDDVTLFLKRLRQRIGSFRYYYAGEYGDKSLRPHYHMILFTDFKLELKLWFNNFQGDAVYTCNLIDEVWRNGITAVSSFSWQTAAYVSRYVCKKLTGERSVDYVKQGISPEFSRMSRRPGIGADFAEQHFSMFVNDEFFLPSVGRVKPPRYFQKLYEAKGGDLSALREKRKQSAIMSEEYIFEHLTDYSHDDFLRAQKVSVDARYRLLRRDTV